MWPAQSWTSELPTGSDFQTGVCVCGGEPSRFSEANPFVCSCFGFVAESDWKGIKKEIFFYRVPLRNLQYNGETEIQSARK